MKLANAGQMGELDQASKERGVPGRVLMENAGRAVSQTVMEVAAEMAGAPAVLVIAGRGNNGGDGFVAARHLHDRGLKVRVAVLGSGAELKGDAADNFAAAREYGVEIVELPGAVGGPEDAAAVADALAEVCAGADIIVDAVLGTGLHGEVRSPAREAIEAMNASRAIIVAVDMPSGIGSDTGEVCGVAVEADATVTFGLPKVGQVLHPGAAYCGDLQIIDIGLPPEVVASAPIRAHLITREMARLSLPPRWPAMHKGNAGRVLIVAGSRGYTGAAAMAAMAALRAGAGLAYLAVPRSINDVLEVKCTEPITLPMPETDAGSLAPEAADAIVEFAATCDAVAVGPGLSRHPATARLVADIVARIDRPLVLDADGLNCLADTDTAPLAGRQAPTIITPHPGELARLMNAETATLQADRLGAARAAADLMSCVVVFKGAGTVIARPDEEAWVNTTGNQGMATGGTGDVLTGMVAAFLAGGVAPEEAAIAGVYFHGLAGDLAAEGRDARSIVASDLLAQMGRAFVAEEEVD